MYSKDFKILAQQNIYGEGWCVYHPDHFDGKVPCSGPWPDIGQAIYFATKQTERMENEAKRTEVGSSSSTGGEPKA